MKRVVPPSGGVECFAYEIQPVLAPEHFVADEHGGAPNTPRSTASWVTALSRSLVSCAPASASSAGASKPAFCKTAPTIAGSFMFRGSTHIAW